MRFTQSWLEDHLRGSSLDAILETLPQIGLEVENLTPAMSLDGFQLAQITEINPHPQADRLHVVKVKTKDGDYPGQIVCGAPSLRLGQISVLAYLDALLPSTGKKLRPTKIRGEESLGMLCSGAELGINDEADDILDLDEKLKLEMDVVAALGLDDVIFDVETTPNRPDWTGVRGIARDLAAAHCGELIAETEITLPETITNPIHIQNTGAEAACPFFVGRFMRGIQNKPAPDWMQRRIRAAGLRPINMLVDITNYICLDRARPLHVYDADKIRGDIILRMAKAGEKLEALDGQTYRLEQTMCVIADSQEALGLGGVIGGMGSAVSDETEAIFIESAWFDPTTILRAGRALNIQSDARYRFERGVDPAFTIGGCNLAAKMISEICGGQISPLATCGTQPDQTRSIYFTPQQIKKRLGLEIEDEQIKNFLDRLGFQTEQGREWKTTPPTWRPDIGRPDIGRPDIGRPDIGKRTDTKDDSVGVADLSEEIARLYGVNDLPETPMALAARPVPLAHKALQLRRARFALAANGFVEAVCWSFLPEKISKLFCENYAELRLENPISEDLASMRTSLLPGLLLAAAHNLAYGRRAIALFEAGHCFQQAKPQAQYQSLAAIKQGHQQRHWQKPPAVNLWSIKAPMIAALDACGIDVEKLAIINHAPHYFHPAGAGGLGFGQQNPIGFFGEIHPAILSALDIESPCFGFEINLDSLPQRKKIKTQKPEWTASLLQAVRRDFSFIVPKDLAAFDLIKVAKKALKGFENEIHLFDVFQDKKLLSEDKKSLTIEVSIQPKQNLTEQAIDEIAQKLVEAIEKEIGGKLRD